LEEEEEEEEEKEEEAALSISGSAPAGTSVVRPSSSFIAYQVFFSSVLYS
jgi:hypothetical protein